MTIYYFTATGNSLAVAKAFGGQLISIPSVMSQDRISCTDDVIGLVFPVYAYSVPYYIKCFLKKWHPQADYRFAVGTYGNYSGAVMQEFRKLAVKNGIPIDYLNTVLTVDNYLQGFDIRQEIARLPSKQTDQQIAAMLSDIQNRKVYCPGSSLAAKGITAVCKHFNNGKFRFTGQYFTDEHCILCQTCAKVCPTGNITVTDRVIFHEKCIGCQGCIHACPRQALHIKGEKSTARWRNPSVSLKELIDANRQSGKE